jgi:hypothetical protein
MVASVAIGIAWVAALAIVIRRGGRGWPWRAAGVLVFGVAWQFSLYGIGHNWAVTYHGRTMLLIWVQLASMGLIAVGAIWGRRTMSRPARTTPPPVRRPEV